LGNWARGKEKKIKKKGIAFMRFSLKKKTEPKGEKNELRKLRGSRGDTRLKRGSKKGRCE